MNNAEEIERRVSRAVSELQAVLKLLKNEQPKFPAAAAKLLEQGLCLLCKEPLTNSPLAPTRGLHQKCYKQVTRAMKASGESEDDAVAKGMVAPSKLVGRKPKHAGLDKLADGSKKPMSGRKKRTD